MVAETIPLVPEPRAMLNKRRGESACAELFSLLDAVKDPELPVLSIWDLGILQDVREKDGAVTVTITPTYSGCPAMQQIADDIESVVLEAGYKEVCVEQRLSPAWTTDWLDAGARKRLVEYGVAEPANAACPQCGSEDVQVVSEFGSTACKAMLKCMSCLEPFDQFKRL